jgi:hypothetical protein
LTRVASVAERLILGETAAAQADRLPPAKAELIPLVIEDVQLAFDPQRAIVEYFDRCHLSLLCRNFANPIIARRSPALIAPALSADVLPRGGR